MALSLLVPRLTSHDALVRANAYDFLVHLVDIPLVHERVLAALEDGKKREAGSIDNIVMPALNRFPSTAPATR